MNPNKVGWRTVQSVFTVKAKSEGGGGSTMVEKRASRTIDQMYARMLATGELQNAQMLKSNNHGAKERATALMNNAQVAPNYMREGEVKAITDKLINIETKTKKANKKKAQDEIVNKLAEEKAKEIQERRV